MTTAFSLITMQAKLDALRDLFDKHDAHEWLNPQAIDDSPRPAHVYALCRPMWSKNPFTPSETTLKALAAFGKDGWKLAHVYDGWQCCHKLVDGVLVELHQAYPIVATTQEPELVDPALLTGGAA